MSRGSRDPTKGILKSSMRENYSEHGVDEVSPITVDRSVRWRLMRTKYYRKVGGTYRNPHFPGVRSVLFQWFNRHVALAASSLMHTEDDMSMPDYGLWKKTVSNKT